MRASEFITEKWSAKYKRSIDCSNPKGFSQKAHCAGRKKNESVAEGTLNEYRNALYDFIKSKFPTWPEYVLKDFLYAQAKSIQDQEQLKDFLELNQKDFGQVKWRLEKLPITLDIFTPKTQRMIKQREGGSSNPFQVPKDAERHAQQLKMIQQQGVRTEPIIVAKLNNGYDLIEGWHRTIQHLQQYPEGYTGPAWVAYGATYTSESKQGVTEGLAQDIPDFLYHATYRPLLKSIKQHGLGGDKAQAKWEDSRPGVVYLAIDPNVAKSYAETSDVVPDEWLDQIVILKISTNGLKNKLQIDKNVLDNEGDTLEYHGIIPLSHISMYKQGVAEGSEQKYLWHGSRQKIDMLEPRQSVDTGGAAGSNQNAIYATSDPKVAIAMGLTTHGSDTGMFPNDPQMVLFKGNIRKGENVYLHKVPFNGANGKPQFVQGGNSREFHTIPGVKGIKPVEIKVVPVDKYLNLIRQATPADLALQKKYMRQGVAEGVEHNQQDLDDVADWLNTTPDNLSVEVKQEPIEKFIKQIREMYGTYDEFPEDEERTSRILKLLKRGAKPLPIYVEANDPDLFVMEGRHRMVAFWLAGMKTIPVAYVSKNINENFADGKVKGKSRPGRVKRAGASCKGSVTDLRAKAKKYSGEKGKMYHWCANMKGGKK